MLRHSETIHVCSTHGIVLVRGAADGPWCECLTCGQRTAVYVPAETVKGRSVESPSDQSARHRAAFLEGAGTLTVAEVRAWARELTPHPCVSGDDVPADALLMVSVLSVLSGPWAWARLLVERDDVEGPNVLRRMVEWYSEHDGRADDFGRLRIVIDAQRALDEVSDEEQADAR